MWYDISTRNITLTLHISLELSGDSLGQAHRKALEVAATAGNGLGHPHLVVICPVWAVGLFDHRS